MENTEIKTGKTQTDFIRKDLNFDIVRKDPSTKAALADHPLEEWIDILGNGQLKKKVIIQGQNGTRPNTTDYCTLKMIGVLENGKLVENHENITIQLGDVEIIQGLDLAIALMNVGEVAVVEVASRFAYGTLGREPDIPPNATIWYSVELKSVELETDIETLSISKRKEIGNKKRIRGNWWFARNEHTIAIQCYRRALDFLIPSNNSSTDEIEESATDTELQDLLENRMAVYNNLTAAQIKTEAYDAALKNVENVLTCQPQNIKALFRKGRIYHLKGEHSLAYATFLQAAKLDPESKAIRQELAILKRKNVKDAQHEKILYRKMLGTQKMSGASTKNHKNNNKNRDSNKLVWSLICGAAVTIAGVLIYKFTS
ncbi:peptidyl-prolyl cis-trans isomerase FKBP8 [Polistes fuscatus]|uniref:peptidyl-prolyl cis-trans isomerase FKBP8 n=1 Tax=Polistes fuscatus TaxID=30207 RepID=UPI001CA81AD3|nr:peptidyl-prolyl cis-trans isomerase FKBP8 [Polistes fuscatus]